MKVKWTEKYTNVSILDNYPEANLSDLDQNFEGEVVGNGNSFWNGPYFIVACQDGKCREVGIDKIQVCQ